MNLSVEIAGVKRLTGKLTAIPESTHQKVKRAIQQATALVEAGAKPLCPVDTGTLRASIRSRVDDGNGKIVGRVFTGVEYAAYVEFGTGALAVGTYPYKTDKPLSYSPKKAWHYKDSEGVWHIGVSQPARPFLGRAFNEDKRTIRQLLTEATKGK